MDDLFDGGFGFILKYFVGGSILLHLALIFVCSFARVSSLSEMESEYGNNPAIWLCCVIPGACYLLISFIMIFAAPVPSYLIFALFMLIGIPILGFFTSFGMWALIVVCIAAGVIYLTGGALLPLLMVLIAPGTALAIFLFVMWVVFVILDSFMMFF